MYFTGKPVELPENQIGGAFMLCLIKHVLQSRSFYCSSRDTSILKFTARGNDIAVFFCVLMGRLPLLVNGNVPLCVRAITIVAKGDISRISLELFHFVSHCNSLLSCLVVFVCLKISAGPLWPEVRQHLLITQKHRAERLSRPP